MTVPTKVADATEMEKGLDKDVKATPVKVEETTPKIEDAHVEIIDDATQNIIDNAGGDTTKLANQIRSKDTAYNTARQDAVKAQTALYEQKKKTVEESPYYLLDLYKEDPETAELIAQEIWELPYNQIEEQMFKKKDEDKSPDTAELVKREVEKELRTYRKDDEQAKVLKECETLISSFMSKNDVDAELEEQVTAEYKFLAQGRDLTPQVVERLVKAAYTSVTGKKANLPSLDETIIETAAMKAPQGQQPTQPKKRITVREKEVTSMFTLSESKAFGQ